MSCYSDTSNFTIKEEGLEYLQYVMVAYLITNLLTLIVDYRQLLRYKDTKVHPYLKEQITQSDFT